MEIRQLFLLYKSWNKPVLLDEDHRDLFLLIAYVLHTMLDPSHGHKTKDKKPKWIKNEEILFIFTRYKNLL